MDSFMSFKLFCQIAVPQAIKITNGRKRAGLPLWNFPLHKQREILIG